MSIREPYKYYSNYMNFCAQEAQAEERAEARFVQAGFMICREKAKLNWLRKGSCTKNVLHQDLWTILPVTCTDFGLAFMTYPRSQRRT